MLTEPVVTLDQDRIARVRLLKTQMAHKTKEIGWDDANLQDPEERARFTEQELEKARARRRKVVADLQQQGLIDSQGRRVKKEYCQFGCTVGRPILAAAAFQPGERAGGTLQKV
jgi:hypothetical protein